MFYGRDESRNLRDEHMTETLAALISHFDSGHAKIIVWAHSSHLGDARATAMSERGEWNVGQLVRERFGGRVFGIGFTTFSGDVTAARDWGDLAERRRVRPGLRGSYEELFHRCGLPNFWLDLRQRNAATKMLRERRLERAIGVIYRPETERWSTILNRACLSSSTPSSTSMKRMPSNRWNAAACGNATSCRRLIRRDYDLGTRSENPRRGCNARWQSHGAE